MSYMFPYNASYIYIYIYTCVYIYTMHCTYTVHIYMPVHCIDGGKKFETFSNSCFSKTLAYIFKTKWPTDRLITRLQHMQSLFNLVPVFKNYTSQPFGNRAHQIQPHLQRDHMLAFEDFLFQFFNIFGVFGFNIILQNSPKVFNR